MKKFLSVFLTVMMILSLFSTVNVFADGDAVFTLDNVTGQPGSSVKVKLSLSSSEEINSIAVSGITYDTDLLTFEGFSDYEHIEDLTILPPSFDEDKMAIVIALKNATAFDGDICTLNFKIKDDAEDCTTMVSATSVTKKGSTVISSVVTPSTVTVQSQVLGDINGDINVDIDDAVALFQYSMLPDLYPISYVGNVDFDSSGTVDIDDAVRLFQYSMLPDLYPLDPSKPQCQHSLTEVPYKAPTSTENGNIAYWVCSECKKLFKDANGNTSISINDTIIPKVEGAYTITYYVDNNDEYLQSLDITNSNPEFYYSETGLELQDLHVNGYNFVGWFTAQTGGTQVTEIPAGSTGNKTLYAHWESIDYKIQYMCDMSPQADDTYTYGVEKLLPAPTLDKYTFVGWSDVNGKIWKTIPAGTAGNLILYANWSSDRNKAIPVEHLSEPTIMTDSQNGLIYFSYKIGKIVNVPLYQMSEFLTANGVETEITTTKSTSQKVQTSQEIAKTLSEATTNSTSWALSNDWNNVTEVSEKYLEEHGLEREIAEALAKNSAGSYTVGYQSGGTSGTVNVSDSSYAISNNSAQHREFEHQNEESVVSTVDHKFNAEIGASFPISVLDVNAKVGYNYENNKVTSTSESNKYAGTNDWSRSENYSEAKSNTSSNSKSWNSTSNSTSSWSETKTNSVKNAISEMVTREYNTNNSYSLGGSESNTIGKSTVTGEENKLSSTVLYDTTNITTEAVTYRTTGNTHGAYRIVLAGTLQVYAVVIYDIATKEYSVQTYSVLGDGSDNDAPKPYLDYSWAGNQFNDYQNSVLPFEIPYEVNGYVNSLVAKTDGLKFNPDKAQVTEFDNELGSELVYVPTYISINNGDDTYSFTQIKSLSKDLFKNNTDIKAVRLGNGITEIPEGAFEGCTNLTDIYAPNVTKIDSRAFAGCENLNNFTISEDIAYIGSKAFDGVSSIDAMASSVDVAQAVAQSGAKNIVLNISKIPDDKKNNIEFNIGNIEKFELRGGGNEYPGLSITSDAKTTVLNRITFTQNTTIPMTLSSENVTLDQVSVDCTGYALVLKAPNTKLTLNRTINNLMSSTGVAVICRNIAITEMDGSSFEGGMQVKGDVLVCDSYLGDELVEFNSGEFKVITDDEYENYLTLRKVTFDANGGMVSEVSKMVAMNSAIGTLPAPTRDYYTFDGWYTGEYGGEKITDKTIVTFDITVYAHWIHNDAVWALAEDVPSDAEIVDRKWKYTLTSYTESNSSTLSGWTKYDTTSEWSDYGNWSSWQDSSVSKSDSIQVETRDVISGYNKKTQWHYDRWYGTHPTYGWVLGWPWEGTYTKTYEVSGWLDYRLPEQGYDSDCGRYQYGRGYVNGRDCYWYNEQSRQVDDYNSPIYKKQYRYRERELIYTYYYYKRERKESTIYPFGENISDIQEYVQYRAKDDQNVNIVQLEGIIFETSDNYSESTTETPSVQVDITNDLQNNCDIGVGIHQMYVDDYDIFNYVGRKCRLYVEYDQITDKFIIKDIYQIEVDSLIIDIADIVEINKDGIEYYISDTKKKTATIDWATVTVFYNGVDAVVNDVIPDSLMDMSGTIELSLLNDATENGGYDTLYITAYDIFVVDEVISEYKSITSKVAPLSFNRINYDENDGVRATLYDVDGVEMEWTELKEDDVLLVKYVDAGAKEIYEAKIIENTVSTTVETKNATFITKVSDTTDENGYDVVRVTGFNGLEEVSYICDDTDVLPGDLVVPVYKANGDINYFNVVGDDFSITDEYEGVAYGTLELYNDGDYWSSPIDTKRKTVVVDGEEYKVNSSANIYVYDSTSTARNKYRIGETLDYVEYDMIEENGDYDLYIDGEEANGKDVAVYLYIYNDDVVDLVYYIY